MNEQAGIRNTRRGLWTFFFFRGHTEGTCLLTCTQPQLYSSQLHYTWLLTTREHFHQCLNNMQAQVMRLNCKAQQAHACAAPSEMCHLVLKLVVWDCLQLLMNPKTDHVIYADIIEHFISLASFNK